MWIRSKARPPAPSWTACASWNESDSGPGPAAPAHWRPPAPQSAAVWPGAARPGPRREPRPHDGPGAGAGLRRSRAARRFLFRRPQPAGAPPGRPGPVRSGFRAVLAPTLQHLAHGPVGHGRQAAPPDGRARANQAEEVPRVIGVTRPYSASGALRRRDFSQPTAEEYSEIKALIAPLAWQLDQRRPRRRKPGRGPQIDFRRTLR